MANLVQEKALRELIKVTLSILPEFYGRDDMSAMLIVSPFGEEQISDYISNMSRDSAIKVLRELADRLERNETMPAAKGEA